MRSIAVALACLLAVFAIGAVATASDVESSAAAANVEEVSLDDAVALLDDVEANEEELELEVSTSETDEEEEADEAEDAALIDVDTEVIDVADAATLMEDAETEAEDLELEINQSADSTDAEEAEADEEEEEDEAEAEEGEEEEEEEGYDAASEITLVELTAVDLAADAEEQAGETELATVATATDEIEEGTESDVEIPSLLETERKKKKKKQHAKKAKSLFGWKKSLQKNRKCACQLLERHNSRTVAACRSHCRENARTADGKPCNAVNWNAATAICDLRRCPIDFESGAVNLLKAKSVGTHCHWFVQPPPPVKVPTKKSKKSHKKKKGGKKAKKSAPAAKKV